MFAKLFALLQHLLPKHLLTAIVWHLARIRTAFVKDALIRGFVRIYKVDVDEVAHSIPEDFESFNAFFTRTLAPGSRPIAGNPESVISPVDGTISAAASIDKQMLFQAKGLSYSLEDLFAADLDHARSFENGCFATIYLAPYNYHRVHMPVDAELCAAHYVPGSLYSVNSATVANVRGLFRRNERLNLHFNTAHGPVSLIFVGALNVGSISTPWTGEIRPRKRGVVETLELSNAQVQLKKGDLLGWFNMGSTVILLMPEGVASLRDELQPGTAVRMGESIATIDALARTPE